MAIVPTPSDIAGTPTSLIGQNKIWGVKHDGIEAGIVRSDVFWSNYFIGPSYDWANVPAADGWTLQLVYEHVLWTTKLDWPLQKKAAANNAMPIASAAADAFALNAILAATGIRLRGSTYSRTSTIFDGVPLDVYSFPLGVSAFRNWVPESAYENIAASVWGVPRDFVA